MADGGAPVEGLRALSEDERRLVEAHPLPDGVPDAIVSKYQLADALAVSETTLDKWRRAGLPAESEGTNGRAYEFRLSIAYAWVQARRARDAAERLHAEDAAQQLRLSLVGEGHQAEARAQLDPRQQREIIEAELRYMEAARRRGELVERDEVIEAMERIFAIIRDGLDALPDRLGRELALDGAQIEAAQAACDDVLGAAQRAIAEGLDHGRDREPPLVA